MKKLMLMVLLLGLCLLAAGCGETTEAAEYTVHMPAATPEAGVVPLAVEGVSVALNPGSDFICVTRDSSAMTYTLLGMDKESVVQSMTESNIYMLLFDANNTMEVQLSVAPVSHESYDDMTGYPVALLTASLKSDLVTSGYDVLSCELMQDTGHRFCRALVSTTYADGVTDYWLLYETCQAGHWVTVSVLPYEGAPITEEMQQQVDALVESIRIR